MAIPNIVPQAIVLLFYITAFAFGAPVTMILENTLCAAATMLLMFGFFIMGYIGGGGAKLIDSLSIWLGFSKVLGLFLLINAAILVMAVLVLRIVRPLFNTGQDHRHPRLAGRTSRVSDSFSQKRTLQADLPTL